jgi:hypothetical protein
VHAAPAQTLLLLVQNSPATYPAELGSCVGRGARSTCLMCPERGRDGCCHTVPASTVPTWRQHAAQQKFMDARLRVAWAPCARLTPGWTPPLPAGSAATAPCLCPVVVSFSVAMQIASRIPVEEIGRPSFPPGSEADGGRGRTNEVS